jgi:hypothetical protein
MDLKIVIKRLRDIEPVAKSEKEFSAINYAASRRRGSVTFSSDLISAKNGQGRSHEGTDSNQGADESSGPDASELPGLNEPRVSAYWNAAESVFDLSIPVLVSRQNSFVFYVYKRNRLQNPFTKNHPTADSSENTEALTTTGTEDHGTQKRNPKLLAETKAHRWKSAGSLFTSVSCGASVRGRRQSVIAAKPRTDTHLDSFRDADAFHDAKAFWLAEGRRLIAEGNRLTTGLTHGDSITDCTALEAQMHSLFASGAAEAALLETTGKSTRAHDHDQLADGGPYDPADRPPLSREARSRQLLWNQLGGPSSSTSSSRGTPDAGPPRHAGAADVTT